MEVTSPAQQLLVTDLLQWEQPRPLGDPALRDELRGMLDDGLSEVVAKVPAGERLFLGKSSIAALVCEGRYLDQEESPFSWSQPLVNGKLAHRAIELDQASHRAHGADEIVEHAWREMASAQDSLGDWLSGLDRIAASAMRHTCEQRVADFRDTWPLLPAAVQVRTETRIEYTAGNGAVVVRGTPDLLLGQVRDDRCRMLLIDLKTGLRNPMVERQDLRLYALLATLKYGLPPFRWATYYVSEGAWDAEDLDPDLLRGAARRVIDGARKAVRLRFDRPPDAQLQLRGGAWCRFCGRRAGCPAAESADDLADLPDLPF